MTKGLNRLRDKPNMKEIVIISGKGGTGKTTLTASFAALASKPVLADCDVDAADLHLVMNPEIQKREDFSGGKIARIKPGHCTACGKCEELCRFDAIFFDGPGNGTVPKTFRIDPIRCEGCGVCAWFCADKAIDFREVINGQVFESETRFGPMVHARLGVAEENSGKLVTLVRTLAKKTAERESRSTIIIDGSPGIGCPVISSIAGADGVVVVTEPTLSGQHDLERILDLAGHFGITATVVVNKWTINEKITEAIEARARERGVAIAGRIRYDRQAVEAVMKKITVVEHTSEGIAEDIRAAWETTSECFSIL